MDRDREKHEEKNHGPYSLRYALGALLVRVGAAAGGKDSPDRGSAYGLRTDPVNSRRLDVFRQSLRDLGYIEGKNITIEYRYGEGKSERLSAVS